MPTTKPVSITDNTAAGAEAFLQKVQRDVREMFRRKGRFLPTVFMVGDRDPDTCEMLDEPAATIALIDPGFMESNVTKNDLVVTMNELAVGAGAFGLVFAVEMWMKYFLGERPEDSLEAFRASGGSLNDDKHAEGRTEGILLAFEHRAVPGEAVKIPGGLRSTIYVAQIHRPGRGKPHLGPWQSDYKGFEGRFNGLLPDDDYMNRAGQVLDAISAAAKEMGIPRARAAEILARGRFHRPGQPPPKWLAQRLREME